MARSIYCEGERCFCGAPADYKVEEALRADDWSLADDGPMGSLPRETRGRHPLTAYVCARHFRRIMGRTIPDRPAGRREWTAIALSVLIPALLAALMLLTPFPRLALGVFVVGLALSAVVLDILRRRWLAEDL